MRAVMIERFGGPDVLQVAEVPQLEVGAGQVRITVQAAAVNPVDAVTRAGVLEQAGLHGAPPVRLGWDVHGRVDAVGAGVRRIRPGQLVIGLSDRLGAASKAQAEQVVLPESAVAAVPGDLAPAVASTLPLAGSTAWQALERLDLRAGQTVLITGAGGAVGQLALQLGVLRGLRVIACGRPHDARRAVDLGAEWFVDSVPDLADAVRRLVPDGVDGALDAAGLGIASLDAVRNGGAHVSLNVTDRPPPLRAITSTSLAVSADWQVLTLLGALASAGTIGVQVAREFGLDEVRAAHDLVAAGGVRGRVVLRP